MTLNRVILVGRLASAPVLLGFTAREKTIVGLSVDVSSRDRFDITLYGRLADRVQGWHASGWFREGRHVLVEARLASGPGIVAERVLWLPAEDTGIVINSAVPQVDGQFVRTEPWFG